MPKAMPSSHPSLPATHPKSHSCLSSPDLDNNPRVPAPDTPSTEPDHAAARSTIPLVRVGDPVHVGHRVQPGPQTALELPGTDPMDHPDGTGRRSQVLLHSSFRLMDPQPADVHRIARCTHLPASTGSRPGS